jgi:hypothetical protein
MSEWQPIETAPKDGYPILVTTASYAYALQRCKIVYWAGIIEASEGHPPTVGWHDQFDDENEDEPLVGFTHWMALPPPPSDSDQEISE